jgi:hypothetical protein
MKNMIDRESKNTFQNYYNIEIQDEIHSCPSQKSKIITVQDNLAA